MILNPSWVVFCDSPVASLLHCPAPPTPVLVHCHVPAAPAYRFSIDDSPYTTDLILEEGAAGKTDVAALIVMDGISDARVRTSVRHGKRSIPPPKVEIDVL